MTETMMGRVDAKGRLVLPPQVRRRWRVAEGAMVFMQEQDGELRIRPAINPFDVLAEQAEVDLSAGKTKSLRQYAAEHSVALDAD